MTRVERSQALYRRAARVIPGGVNSPVRAFGAVGGTPRFFAEGRGRTCGTWTGTGMWTWSARGDR